VELGVRSQAFIRILIGFWVVLGTVRSEALAASAATKGALAVQATTSPADLALLRVDPSGFLYVLDPYPVTVEVKNVGGEASGAYTVKFYASSLPPFGGNSYFLGAESQPSLAAGESITFTSGHTVFGFLPPVSGTFYIGAKIIANDINKLNNNNYNATPVRVAGGGGPGFEINAGLNDAWYNPETFGQGFFITVLPFPNPESRGKKMFLAWFTYDTERPPSEITAILGEPGHRWLTAYGDYSGDTAVLDIEITQGGVFNSTTPPATQEPGGVITVTFTDCANGILSYDIPSIAESGIIPIQRIADDNVPWCESMQPPQ